MPFRSPLKRQSGVAIIIVMVAVTVILFIGAEMLSRSRLEIKRAQTLQGINLINNIGYAGERFAIFGLKAELESNEALIDELGEPWSEPIPEYPVTDGASIGGCIYDLSGKLNINNLLDVEGQKNPIYLERFRRLFDQLDIPSELVDALVDWIDPDQEPTGTTGAENDYYLGLTIPYRAANTDMLSITELRMLRGFVEEPEYYDKILPHVAALPRGSTLNVNTATREVLLSLASFMDKNIDKLDPWTGHNKDAALFPECASLESTEEAAGLGDSLQAAANSNAYIGPFQSVGDFNKATLSREDDGKTLELNGDQATDLSVKSEYFMLNVRVNRPPLVSTRYTVLQRSDDGKSRVIWRSDNTL